MPLILCIMSHKHKALLVVTTGCFRLRELNINISMPFRHH